MQIMLRRYVHFHSSETSRGATFAAMVRGTDTACWTCKIHYGSSGQLKKHVDEERIKSELDSHVDQKLHQMSKQEHVV